MTKHLISEGHCSETRKKNGDSYVPIIKDDFLNTIEKRSLPSFYLILFPVKYPVDGNTLTTPLLYFLLKIV